MVLAQAAGWQSVALPTAGALVGYLILIFINPAHSFFRDGLRCVQRHPRMWIWLSVLGLAYTLFQNLQAYQLGEAQFSLASLLYWPGFKPHDWRATAGHAWLPALELLAGLFNQAVVSYPTSAAAAFLFTINWRGYQMQFLRAEKGRWGDGGSESILAWFCALLRPSASRYFRSRFIGSTNILTEFFYCASERSSIGCPSNLNTCSDC